MYTEEILKWSEVGSVVINWSRCTLFKRGTFSPSNKGMSYEMAYGEECGKRMRMERSVSMSARMTGRTPWNKGKRCSQLKGPSVETGKKISIAKKGIHQTPQHRRANALAKSHKWMIVTPIGCTKMIVNLKEYCRIHNLSDSAMSQVSKGKAKQHHGYSCKKI